MLKKIRMMRVSYPDIRVPQWQGRKLRGFFAADGGEGSLLHNHGEGGRSIYRYPLVQYKIVRGVPTVVAAEAGISQVYPLVMDRQTLCLGDQRFPRGHMQIDLSEARVGDTPSPLRYRFCAPWFGLNQDNYALYRQADENARKELLVRVLAGNLLSLSKGLDVTVERRLCVSASLRERLVRFKEETVLGFVGEFSVNYAIPPLLGLGKSVSRGFGVTRPAPEPREKTP